MANKFNIKILHNNYEILRKWAHLSKGDFCKLIGIANVYRMDYSSIGAKLLKGIVDNFPGIDEAWLLTPHDVNKPSYIVHESYPAYDPAAAGVPAQHITKINLSREVGDFSNGVKFAELFRKTTMVLESNTIYSTALRSNIEAFHKAITNEETLERVNKRIDNMEEENKKLKEEIGEIKDRLPAIGE